MVNETVDLFEVVCLGHDWPNNWIVYVRGDYFEARRFPYRERDIVNEITYIGEV